VELIKGLLDPTDGVLFVDAVMLKLRRGKEKERGGE